MMKFMLLAFALLAQSAKADLNHPSPPPGQRYVTTTSTGNYVVSGSSPTFGALTVASIRAQTASFGATPSTSGFNTAGSLNMAANSSLNFSSFTIKEFPAFFNSQSNLGIQGTQADLTGAFTTATGPDVSIFPRGVSASSATSKDYSVAGELDFVGCDPIQDANCLNSASGGLAEHALANASPLFGIGQAAGQNSTQYSLSLFGVPGRFLDYAMFMTTDAVNGPSWIPLDVSTNATVLNLATTGSSIQLAPNGGRVGVGTSSPASLLDVNGAATIRGQETVVGSMTIITGNLKTGTTGLFVTAKDSFTFVLDANRMVEIRQNNVTGSTGSFSVISTVYGGNDTGGAGWTFRSARGSVAAPIATSAGMTIGQLTAVVNDGVNPFATISQARFNFLAEETATPTAKGVRITFDTTNAGTTTRTEKMVIKGSGNVGIGNTNPIAKLQVSSGSVIRDGAGWIVTTDTAAVTQLSGCGTGATFLPGSGDSAGKINVQTTGATSCVMTFKTAPPTGNAPACVVTNETTANLMRATSTSSQVTFAGTTVTGDVIAYICIGL